MGKKKPYSLRDNFEIENALGWLGKALAGGDEIELEEWINLLAEEPKQVLALGGHKLVEWSRDALMAIIVAITKPRDDRPQQKLELTAAYLLHWLEALQRHAPAGWDTEPPGWPFKWEEEIRRALFAFVTSRDSLKVESTRNARRQGGKERARLRSAEAAERRQQIREHADRLRASGLDRDIAAILAKKVHLSTSHIRRILKQKPS